MYLEKSIWPKLPANFLVTGAVEDNFGVHLAWWRRFHPFFPILSDLSKMKKIQTFHNVN